MNVAVYDRWPRRMLVGAGASKQLADEIKRFGKKKVLILTDSGLSSFDFVGEIRNDLTQAGLEVFLFDGIRSHPSDQNVADASKAGKQFGADVLVSLGGGSSIDAARGVNMVFSYGGDIRDHAAGAGKYSIDRSGLMPHIAVPTTAGTGGEVAGGGGIYCLDAQTGKTVEVGMGDVCLVPDVAILDPLLTVSLPPYVTAFTGMDALTHAIESIFSINDFSFSDGLGYEAVHLVGNNLITVMKEPRNIAARENMLVAACMATVAFSQTRLGLCHSMAMPLSVLAHVPHGVGNALLLPHIFRLNASARPDRAVRIAKALGVADAGMDKENVIEQAAERITRLLPALGLPVYLDDTGFTKEMIPEASELARHCRFTEYNPVVPSVKEIGGIYLGCFRRGG